jgi:phosphoribosylformylglycinamidine cyclo-ligase
VQTSYKSSGVNIQKADDFVHKIKPLVRGTFTKSVLSGLGNFGAFFQPDFKKYKNPVLVSSVDGVGTKVKLAATFNRFDTVGEDLVNHCVNDIAVCGAVPLFFLDYYAMGHLDTNNAVDIVSGLVRGCKNNGLSLIGGETAEMPGLYDIKDFDLAGAIVGIVDKNKIVNYANVKKGDVLIGLKSNGLHTNGYSLIRRIFNTRKLNYYIPDLKHRLIDEFLKVHKSYLKIIQSSLNNFNIKSISHITGGGIVGNTSRVIPKGTSLSVDWNSWKRPFIFDFIQKRGNVSETCMQKTFNLGIGLIFIVSKNDTDNFKSFLTKNKEASYIIGHIK